MSLLILIATGLIVYSLASSYGTNIPEQRGNGIELLAEDAQRRKRVFAEGQIDPIALHGIRDPYKQSMDTQSIYLHVDDARKRGETGLNTLYSAQKSIQDKVAQRAPYWLSVRNRDGRVIPNPFNKKTILPTLSRVGLG